MQWLWGWQYNDSDLLPYAVKGLLGAFSGKAVDGFFLAEHFPAENVICENADGGEEKPQHRKKQAYLTEKVERQLFVVPYLPIEPEVDYTAA